MYKFFHFSFLFTSYCIILFASQNNIGLFDESLLLINFKFADLGLFPYKDFTLYYPPGIYYLAKLFYLLSFDTILGPRGFIWILVAVLEIFILTWVSKTKSNISDLNIKILATTFSFYNIIYFLLGSEPFSVLILLFFCFYVFLYFSNEAKINFQKYLIIILLLLSIFLIRYEVYIICLFILFYNLFIHASYKKVEKFFHFFIFLFFSLIFFMLLILPLSESNINDILSSIFVQPHNIVRNNISYFNFYTIIFIITFIINISLLFYSNNQKFRNFKTLEINLFIISFLFIPYFFRFPDLQHIMPFLFFSFLSISLLSSQFMLRCMNSWAFMLCLTFVYLSLVLKVFDLKKINTDCLSELEFIKKKLPSYNHLYVGNMDYDYLNFNYVYFYLNTDFDISTKYISEEPGIISRCDVQNKIVENLNKHKTIFVFHQNNKNYENKLFNVQKEKRCTNLDQYFNVNTNLISECTLNLSKIYFFSN